ncbi:MAG: 23S rRNA (pseudouridine(1915)-N(3))-methyltransferase RlmH [Gammaproteobacteria bacterium]|nr:23S rRNA (pseudouridine(1915)-N(3))-methyltransferase RlmH [Gammaproteobacteria bacterium]
MLIHLIAVGNRMPAWVEQGYVEYAKRLPAECRLNLIEIAPAKRSKNPDIPRLMRDEAERIRAAIPKGSRVIALEVQGKTWSTDQLSARLADWLQQGSDLALLVGGADGLDATCRASADELWSLSPLTLPHPLVRVLLAEQLYRAWSILQHHPYHRG